MISTYGGQGAAKEDVRSHDHAVVYSSQNQEPLPWEEENITLGAFPVIIEEAGEVLGVMSRLDFGKVYTVEHNVKVLRIGRISPDQIKRLNETFVKIMGFPALAYNSDPDASDSQPEEAVPAANISTSANRNSDPSFPSRYIRGTAGSSERLDKSYHVRKKDYKNFFRIGRVFSTLWSETCGTNADSLNPDDISEVVDVVVYGEKVYSHVRHFVVVREGNRSCTCLPVTSYGGAGHRKPGIQLEEHGFIYCKSPPQKVPGMRSRALKLHTSRGSVLPEPSLVNYSKVYTVETNVKVKDAGELDEDSKSVLLHYFRKVFVAIDEDPPAPGLTPRASATILKGVGAGVDPYYYSPSTSGSYSSGTLMNSTTSDTTTAGLASGYVPYAYASPTAYAGEPTGYTTPSPYGYGDPRYSLSTHAPQTYQDPNPYTSGYAPATYYPQSQAADPYSHQPPTTSGYPPPSGYATTAPVGSTSQTHDSYGNYGAMTSYQDTPLPSIYSALPVVEGDGYDDILLPSLEDVMRKRRSERSDRRTR